MVSDFSYPKAGMLKEAPIPVLVAPLLLAFWNLPLAAAVGCGSYVASGPLLTLLRRFRPNA